jgi:hypothetical protein
MPKKDMIGGSPSFLRGGLTILRNKNAIIALHKEYFIKMDLKEYMLLQQNLLVISPFCPVFKEVSRMIKQPYSASKDNRIGK